MERYSMLLDWKNQYCENDYYIQSNLQLVVFMELEQQKIFFTICVETQKTVNSQSILEKEKSCWKNQAP